jgi:hypothetical protein
MVSCPNNQEAGKLKVLAWGRDGGDRLVLGVLKEGI